MDWAQDVTVTLLKLEQGGVSLEFAPGDAAAVRAAVAELFGTPTTKWFVETADVSFGGETFVYSTEWDDYCLISSAQNGEKMLRQLHGRLASN